jgi:hypothetical protein
LETAGLVKFKEHLSFDICDDRYQGTLNRTGIPTASLALAPQIGDPRLASSGILDI